MPRATGSGYTARSGRAGATASKRFTTSKLARDLDKIEHIQRRGAEAKDLRRRHTMLHVGRRSKDTGSGCPEERPERATPPPKL